MLFWLNLVMHFAAFDIDSAEWACGAQMLAFAAANAALGVHNRHLKRCVGKTVARHKLNGACGATAVAKVAADAL